MPPAVTSPLERLANAFPIWVAGACGLVAAAFLAIRVMQAATLRVLGVEAAVTMVILVAAVAALPRVADRPWAKAAVTALASLAAFAGLAL